MTGLASIRMSHWYGPLPRFGEYLKTRHGRTAFMVVEIGTPVKPNAAYVARFRCERTSATALPAGAVVHEFAWAKRG